MMGNRLSTEDIVISDANVVAELTRHLRSYGEHALKGNGKLCLTTTSLSVVNDLLDQLPMLIQLREQGSEITSQEWQLPSGLITNLDTHVSWDIEFIKQLVDNVHSLQVSNTSGTIKGYVNVGKFPNLRSLELVNVPIHMVQNLQLHRVRLESLLVHCSLDCAKALFELCGGDQAFPDDWPRLTRVDLRYTNLSVLDNSLHLLTALSVLDLSRNSLETTRGLEYLSGLESLNLSYNFLHELPLLVSNRKKKLKVLLMASNVLGSLNGIEDYFSLQVLDVRDNCLVRKEDLRGLDQLNFLLQLKLSGNPLTLDGQYRHNVLNCVSHKVSVKLQLDNHALSSSELRLLQKMTVISVPSQHRPHDTQRRRSHNGPSWHSATPSPVVTCPQTFNQGFYSLSARPSQQDDSRFSQRGMDEAASSGMLVLSDGEDGAQGSRATGGSEADESDLEKESGGGRAGSRVRFSTPQQHREHIACLKSRYGANYLIHLEMPRPGADRTRLGTGTDETGQPGRTPLLDSLTSCPQLPEQYEEESITPIRSNGPENESASAMDSCAEYRCNIQIDQLDTNVPTTWLQLVIYPDRLEVRDGDTVVDTMELTLLEGLKHLAGLSVQLYFRHWQAVMRRRVYTFRLQSDLEWVLNRLQDHLNSSSGPPDMTSLTDSPFHRRPLEETNGSGTLLPPRARLRMAHCTACRARFSVNRAIEQLTAEGSRLLCPLCHSDLLWIDEQVVNVAGIGETSSLLKSTDAATTSATYATASVSAAWSTTPEMSFETCSEDIKEDEESSCVTLETVTTLHPGDDNQAREEVSSVTPTRTLVTLQNEQQQQEEASTVIGGAVDHNCIFYLGSVPTTLDVPDGVVASSPVHRQESGIGAAVCPVPVNGEATTLAVDNELTEAAVNGEASCSDDEPSPTPPPNQTNVSRYVSSASGQVKFYLDDLTRVDHNLQLHFNVAQFEAGEHIKLIVRCNAVYSDSQPVDAIVLVTDRRFHLFQWIDQKEHTDVARCLKKLGQSDLNQFDRADFGLADQWVTLTFAGFMGRRSVYMIQTGWAKRTRQLVDLFISTLTALQPGKHRDNLTFTNQATEMENYLVTTFITNAVQGMEDTDSESKLTLVAAYLVWKGEDELEGDRENDSDKQKQQLCLLIINPICLLLLHVKFNPSKPDQVPTCKLDRRVEVLYVDSAERQVPMTLIIRMAEDAPPTDRANLKVTFLFSDALDGAVAAIGEQWSRLCGLQFCCS